MDEEKVIFKKIKIDFLATKHDKFENELSYFKIKEKNIDERFISIMKEDYKLPFFKTEKGQTILKVKKNM